MRKRDFAYYILATEIISIGIFLYSMFSHHWSSVGWSLSIAVAVPCWVLAVKAPAVCGVTTQRGTPCRNPTTGVLFGCGQASNGSHVWVKFFARFGWRRQSFLRKPPSQTGADDPAVGFHGESHVFMSGPEPFTVRIVEDWRSGFVFWLAIVSTVAGVASAVIDVAALSV